MTDRVKRSLRQTLKRIRNNLSVHFQQEASQQICKRIRQWAPYRYAKNIALYHPHAGEISLHAIWETAPYHGKFCFFPVLTDHKTLLFLPATPKTPFHSNQFGIPEPTVPHSLARSPDLFDIMFMPLLGFDRFGTRLGMGAGYYDRTLMQDKPKLLVGVAYDFQEHTLYSDRWDIKMDVIITPQHIYYTDQLR